MDEVEKIAAAVLYEGYVLWPYRRSAPKNQRRWIFGGVYPPAYSETSGGTDPWYTQTQCMVVGDAPSVAVQVRFLHIVARQVARRNADGALEPVDALQVGQERYLTWDEATERQVALLLTRLFRDAVARGIPPETDARPILAAIDTRRITDRSIRTMAIDSLRPPGKLTPAESLDELGSARLALEEAAQIGNGLALNEVVHPHPTLGPLNGYEWIAFIGAHMARHIEQIRETVRLLSRNVPYQ